MIILIIINDLDLFLEIIESFKDKDYKMFLDFKPKKPNFDFPGDEKFYEYKYKVLFLTSLGQFYWTDKIEKSKSEVLKSIADKFSNYEHETCSMRLDGSNIIIDY